MPRKQVRKKTYRLLGNCTDLVQCSNFKALFFLIYRKRRTVKNFDNIY